MRPVMCPKPSCCNNPRSQGTGIAAVAVIMLAVFIAARIGPIVALIIRTVLEVIRIAAMTTGLVLALAAVTWAAIVITRWQLQRRTAPAVVQTPMTAGRSWEQFQPGDEPGCLACGGTGTVLQATNGSGYQPQDCPVCEPARRVG
jgi:hypothetical protein